MSYPTHLPEDLTRAIDTVMGPISDYSVYVLDGQTGDLTGDPDDWHDALVIAEPDPGISHLAHRTIKFTRDPIGNIEYYFPERNDIDPVHVGGPDTPEPAKPNKPVVIGLTGPAGAGKNAAGDILAARYGYRTLALADAVRDALWQIDPIVTTGHPDAQAEPVTLRTIITSHGWDQAKREYPEIRRLLQKVGTEAGWQLHGQNLWTDLLRRKITEILDQADRPGNPDRDQIGFVITDVRFPHEIELVTSLGGQIWKIDRQVQDLPGQTGQHASEHSISGHRPDHIVDNSGDLDQLHHQLAVKMDQYGPWFDELATDTP